MGKVWQDLAVIIALFRQLIRDRDLAFMSILSELFRFIITL